MVDGKSLEPRYLSRLMTWLGFNERVLEEAQDVSNPVLERARFLGIFASNMDEFFMIRVAGVRELVLERTQLTYPDGSTKLMYFRPGIGGRSNTPVSTQAMTASRLMKLSKSDLNSASHSADASEASRAIAASITAWLTVGFMVRVGAFHTSTESPSLP